MTRDGHCWHDALSGTVSFSGGSQMHTCCHCGFTFPIMYRNDWKSIEGHGPKFKESVRVYTWPDSQCEARDAE